jgi:hypothetical protein
MLMNQGRVDSISFRLSLLVACSLIGASCGDPNEVIQGLLVEVTVTATGTGSGRVTSVYPRLDCRFRAGEHLAIPPGPCATRFEDVGGGGRFLIVAEPDPGSVLAGWTGSCSGMQCNARFDAGEQIVRSTVRFDLAGTSSLDVLSDSFDIGDRWDFRVIASNGAATQFPASVATGGDPGGFRRMEHRIDGVGNIQVFHRYTGATYTPSTSGPIASLAYSEHRILFDPPFAGAGVASGFALEQGGQVYTLNFGGYTNVAWERFERARIAASDFSPAPGPDFSASGPPIRFGFVRSNSNTSAALQRIHHGIDNWRVEISR